MVSSRSLISAAAATMFIGLSGCSANPVLGDGQGSSAATDLVGPQGGTVGSLVFAVTGDTRPEIPYFDYPTGIITTIWQDIQNEQPRPQFAIATGDYMLSDPWSDEGAEMLDTYVGAAANFSNTVFYAMGNHECATLTDVNCGPGSTMGEPNTYTAFMQKMVQPNGYTTPYYGWEVDATDGSWTAKFIVIAGNYWNADQANWLDQAMAVPTTYTFLIRHEGYAATTAPGVPPSEAIMADYPYTLMLAGHVHTWSYDLSHREVITGNGGAPLDTNVNYGYTVVNMNGNGTLTVTGYDYQSHAVLGSFTVDAGGNPASPS